MSNKLAFQVVACSGEDPNYPASQLNIHSASTSGYRSKQYCEFPVEIGFQLTEGECFINQIQILSHQSCIASKIELYVGKGSSYAQAEFKKLGYLSLSTNENSGFKARELKSIYIETSTQFLKFLLLKNHNNGLNLYSQVGIVAINVLGTAQANNGDIINPSDGGAAMPSLKKKQSDDLAFDMHFDKETAEKIRKVHAAKDRAVEEEDYDQAADLKELEDSLKGVGIQIARLSVQKKEAVEVEDYAKAKGLKIEIDTLKESLQEQIDTNPRLAMVLGGSRSRKTVHEPQQVVQRNKVESLPKVEPTRSTPDYPPASPQRSKEQETPRSARFDDLEDRPLSTGANTQQSHGMQGAMEEVEDGQPNPNFNGIPNAENLSDPPALPKGVTADADLMSAVIGEFFTRCAYSTLWQHHDAAIAKVIMDLPKYKNSDIAILQQCSKLVYTGLTDKVTQVYTSGLTLLNALLQRSQHMYPDDVCPVLQPIVTTLAMKLGDGQRWRDGAFHAMEKMTLEPSVGPKMIVQTLLLQPKKQSTQWKRLLAKIQLLKAILHSIGLDEDSDLTLDTLMTYLQESGAITHQNVNVRTAAKELTVELYLIVGDQVNSYLEGLRPKQLEEYHNAFQIGAIQPAGKKEKKRASPPKRAAAAKPTPPVQQVDYDDDDDDDDVEDFTCQFCLKHDASFTDDVLDIHYWSKCEMLTPCGQCEQVIEISCLNDHLLTECKYKNHNKECKRCGEAINADYIKDHVARSDCAVQLPENEANRCPLCHEDIGPGKRGWRDHLLREKCPQNKRSI